MTKNDMIRMTLHNANYHFTNEDYIQCLKELRDAGDIVLAEIKKTEEKKTEKTNCKLL